MHDAHTWAVVLAGGEGTRLQTLTTDDAGVTVPKQFWSLRGDNSLLQLALARAEQQATRARTCVAVSARHHAWWKPELAALPDDNVFIEPSNRGTGIGVISAVIGVLARDPEACIAFMPADHYIEQEPILGCALNQAIAETTARPRRMMLLGIEPAEPDPELGYILPGWRVRHGFFTVHRFIEKPSRATAERLIAQGGVWNSFIWVANGRRLLSLITLKFPQVVAALSSTIHRNRADGLSNPALTALYEQLPSLDFSRDVLSDATETLLVRRVAGCGWSDLGTPERVKAALRMGPRARGPLTALATRSLLTAVTLHEAVPGDQATLIETEAKLG
jgi:mannose-1-phosphate guanylyltransferase